MKKSVLRILTWEDIREIFLALYHTPHEGMNAEDYYKSVLSVLRDESDALLPIADRFPVVLRAAEQATSWMLNESRDRENTLIRQFVAYQLHDEGYSYSEIGRTMGRDHSTVIHHVHRMRDMLSVPNSYKWEVQQYKRFEELCKKQD